MKSLILALFAFLLCLGSVSAGSNMTQVLSALPDGGYIMDMSVDENGTYSITDLNGTHIPGSPFTIDIIDIPPVGPAAIAANGTSIKTKDQWGCDAPGEYVNWDDWRQAGRRLAFWCGVGNMVPRKKIMKWVIGGSEAYICNYAGEQNCDGNEYWNYMQIIADKCNFLGCGWFLQGSGNKSLGRGIKGGKSDPYYVCNNL
ncbi:hypothetical protein PG989_014724 [Apiospora arundinis]